MSTDITTNQISKDAFSSSSVAKPANVAHTEGRQNVSAQTAAQEGKVLPPAAAKTDEADKVEISSEELQQAVAQLNEFVQQIQRDLSFSVDDSSGRTVVRVVNTETEEVVRQMPSDEALRISSNIKDQVDVSGLIFKTSA